MAKLTEINSMAEAFADKRTGATIKTIMGPLNANQLAIANTVSCRALNSSGIAIGTGSKAKLKIVNATLCTVNGAMVVVPAATEIAFTATTHNVATDYMNMFVATVDAAGTCYIHAGTAALTTATIAAVVPPAIPAGQAVLGVVTIAATTPGFVAATTLLDNALVTDLYYSVVGPWDPKASTTTRTAGKLVDLGQYTNTIPDKRDGGLVNAMLSPVYAGQVQNTNALSCRALNTPTLAIGTDTAKVLITNATLCCINGTIALVASDEIAFTATTHNVANGFIAMFLLVADSAGTVTILKGTSVAVAGGIAAAPPPTVPVGYAVLGAVSITGTGSGFVAGTTALTGGDATVLYYDAIGPFQPAATTTGKSLPTYHPSLVQHSNQIADKHDGTIFNQIMTPVLANEVSAANTISCRALNTAGLTIGSVSKKTLKIGNATLCNINGVNTLIASAAVAFTATTHDVADGYINMFVVVADAAGTVTLLPGTAALTSGGIAGVVPPTIPAGRAVLGVYTVSAATAIFNATTDDLDALHLTSAYYDALGPWDPKASTTA